MDPDERDRLIEERDFLLSSLDDLERERAAGDVDEADYVSLRDSYVARAASIIRMLDGDAAVAQPSSPKNPRRRSTRIAVWTALVLVVAAGAGVLVARQAGERLPGQGMTGGGNDGSVSSLLVEARSTGMANTARALELYSQVLAVEPDNVEALTYFGWFTVLSATSDQTSEDSVVRERFQSGLLLIRQAAVTDPTYPDAHCFLGISFYRFLQDAEAAQPEVQACLESNPPAEVKSLVEGLAASIADELDGS
ncbi:MAG: hypothetical protein ACKOJC_00075 [Actinomycetota bacterium]